MTVFCTVVMISASRRIWLSGGAAASASGFSSAGASCGGVISARGTWGLQRCSGGGGFPCSQGTGIRGRPAFLSASPRML